MDFITDINGYEPFAVALILLLAIGALELVLFCIGLNALHFIDDILPDVGELDAPEAASLDKVLGFVGFGRVPTLVVVVLLLSFFSATGIVAQSAAQTYLGNLLPTWLVAGASLVFSVIATGRLSRVLGHFLPSDETSAVYSEALIGQVARISYGDATDTKSATARVKDHLGNFHDIYVKATSPDELFQKGDELLLVSKIEGFYLGTTTKSTN